MINLRTAGALGALLGCLGCAEGAKLVQDTPTGGVVSYAFKEGRGGVMFSKFRKEALTLMAHKCPSGYTIVKEGETKGYQSVAGIIEGTEDDSRYRRWAVQFRCKER